MLLKWVYSTLSAYAYQPGGTEISSIVSNVYGLLYTCTTVPASIYQYTILSLSVCLSVGRSVCLSVCLSRFLFNDQTRHHTGLKRLESVRLGPYCAIYLAPSRGAYLGCGTDRGSLFSRQIDFPKGHCPYRCIQHTYYRVIYKQNSLEITSRGVQG